MTTSRAKNKGIVKTFYEVLKVKDPAWIGLIEPEMKWPEDLQEKARVTRVVV